MERTSTQASSLDHLNDFELDEEEMIYQLLKLKKAEYFSTNLISQMNIQMNDVQLERPQDQIMNIMEHHLTDQLSRIHPHIEIIDTRKVLKEAKKKGNT